MKDIYLTKDGIEKLQEELKQLVGVDRKAIIKKIKETREYGDLAENAEYDSARAEQSMIEGRIEELESILKHAKVINTNHKPSDRVVIGDKVKVHIEGDHQDFFLVGSAESDPSTGHISTESPLGKALLGSKIGDTVKVEIPDGGSVEYQIVSIN